MKKAVPVVIPLYAKLAIAGYVLKNCGCSTEERELSHFVRNPHQSIVGRCRGGKAVTARVINCINILLSDQVK